MKITLQRINPELAKRDDDNHAFSTLQEAQAWVESICKESKGGFRITLETSTVKRPFYFWPDAGGIQHPTDYEKARGVGEKNLVERIIHTIEQTEKGNLPPDWSAEKRDAFMKREALLYDEIMALSSTTTGVAH